MLEAQTAPTETPAAPVEPQTPETDVTASPAEGQQPEGAAAPEKKDPTSARFAALHREDKRIRSEKAALKAERDALAKEAAEIKELLQLKSDPVALLEKLTGSGTTDLLTLVEKLSERLLNADKPKTPEQLAQDEQAKKLAELEAWKAEQEKARQEQLTRADAEKRDAAVNHLAGLVQASPDKYELLSLNPQELPAVVDAIRIKWENEGSPESVTPELWAKWADEMLSSAELLLSEQAKRFQKKPKQATAEQPATEADADALIASLLPSAAPKTISSSMSGGTHTATPAKPLSIADAQREVVELARRMG